VPTCGTVAHEVLRKHFEIPGSKSCLITEKSPSLEAAGFVDMENCVFVDERNVLDKLDYLFQNLDELKSITNAGYDLVHSRHTVKQRNQIFEWFNLSKNLKPGQKIVQANPFEPLTIVDKSSGIKNSHIICNGLHLTLLRQGDEKLWAGKYDEAETLYLRCLNYIYWMPEPKFRLALCSLYKGNAKQAHHSILELVRYILEIYQAADPDPVEWAYAIVSLLCLGKLDEAVKCANQFPLLSHPELDRTRWAIESLTGITCSYIPPHEDRAKYRGSIHQLPNLSHKDWTNNLCSMLQANHQVQLAEKLSKAVGSEDFSIENRQNDSNSTKIKSWVSLNLIDRLSKNRVNVGLNRRLTNLKPKLERVTFKLLNYLELHFGCFLPYHRSIIRNDDFFSAIHQLVKQEDIKVALLIGASVTEGSTKAFLAGIHDNSNQPISFCVNHSMAEFAKLQNHYSNDPFVRCYRVASHLMENLPIDLESEIKIVKQQNKIDRFDAILIDGSQLADNVKIDDIFCEARYIFLDDINNLNNHANHYKMLRDTSYVLIAQNPGLRNGYSIFKKVSS
jgi:tetratricopeptide (TPR) repeat protein